jgi:hypothetical protein
VIDVTGGAAAEKALLGLLDESHLVHPKARALAELGPLADLFDIPAEDRIVTVVLEDDLVESFRRLLSESALVLGCEVTLHLVRLT